MALTVVGGPDNFSILDNEVTQSSEYWKSSRKTLAVCKKLYISLKGSSANPENAQADVNDSDESSYPTKKKLCVMNDKLQEQLSCLKQIDCRVKGLEEKISFADTLVNTFECIICKGITQQPLFSS